MFWLGILCEHILSRKLTMFYELVCYVTIARIMYFKQIHLCIYIIYVCMYTSKIITDPLLQDDFHNFQMSSIKIETACCSDEAFHKLIKWKFWSTEVWTMKTNQARVLIASKRLCIHYYCNYGDWIYNNMNKQLPT